MVSESGEKREKKKKSGERRERSMCFLIDFGYDGPRWDLTQPL